MVALTQDLAEHLARIALGHVGREFPNKPDHVLDDAGDLLRPRVLHPVFYGSFDWHSCVHAHWMLARLLRRFPAMAEAARIRVLFDTRFTPEAVAAECAYLARPSAAGFERPYGWAWLLLLASELGRHPAGWSARLAPLAAVVADRFRTFLPRLTYPVRAGTHANTAFALILAWHYAGSTGEAWFATMLRERALAWYGADADCRPWEPGGEDFLSPALCEALCMRRLLPAEAFALWLEAFLPGLGDGEPAVLFQPAQVSDRRDGRIVHLDGLNLSRAWCWRGLATALPAAAAAAAREAAGAHLQAALPHVAGDYAGEHWLASYAVLALESELA